MLNRKNHITVTIQEPCSEQWHKMEKSEKGRFCLSCQQQVIDFTTMSNVEIIQYLSFNKNVCGRFKEEQLNVPLHVIKTERKSILTNFFISSLFSFFYFSNVKSQEVKEKKIEIVSENTTKDSFEIKSKNY